MPLITKEEGLIMPTGMDNIEHVVVVMFENRSFDNLLGWLYAKEGNNPPHLLPPDSSPPYYEGLVKGKYCNTCNECNPSTICASQPTTGWPPKNNPALAPDPGELFKDVTFQIYGTSDPGQTDQADMSGFLQNYASVARTSVAGQIMQSYGPEQVNVISQLARQFGVSDHWYASAPCQTWPNRGFVHTGSSDGHINNDDYEPYDIRTIFNVLEDRDISWGVFADVDVAIFALTYVQFLPQLVFHSSHFHLFETFQKLCSAPKSASADDKLPAYSFVEPQFQAIEGRGLPNDYHPPHNVCRGEQFLAQVYEAVKGSPYRDEILLVITFDEHGGCYDHVPPPTGAVAPEPGAVSRYDNFYFNRFGVRVPTIVVSSYVESGTVFRSPTPTPYDHTSILATLRDWKQMDSDLDHPFLPSPRIKQAPTLNQVLTLSHENKNTHWPAIDVTRTIGTDDESLDMPLNGVQLGLIVGKLNERNGNKHIGAEAVEKVRKKIKTYQDAIDFMKQNG